MKTPSSLLIAASTERPLTPEQRKFNQLVAKIEQLRAELLAWQEQVALFSQGHAQRVRPLMEELITCRAEAVVRLDVMISTPGWTKTERATMRELVCDLAGSLLEDESIDEARHARLKALYDKHSDTDFDTENREAMAAMKDLFETMSGVDLGDEDFDSEDAMMQRAHERMRAKQDEAQERAPPQRAKRQTAAQRRRESEAQEASQSVREVYRKLASALHPDRATDEADRSARTAQMQRVNQAYDAKDLLALFALQLEIEQVDAAHIAQATAQRAKQYNRVLSEQLGELQAELQVRQGAFCMDFGLDPYQRFQPNKLGALLNREVAELRAALAEANQDLRRLDDPAAAKRWLKQARRHRQSFDDDIPF